jgi:hypothetical protein
MKYEVINYNVASTNSKEIKRLIGKHRCFKYISISDKGDIIW